MQNKVLISIEVPEIDLSFDVFIPVNELIWKITKLIVKSVSDLSGINLDPQNPYILINKINDKIYQNNDLVINTDIRNGTELILLK